MKKVISVLLALIMIVGLLSTTSFASNEKFEEFTSNGNEVMTGDHFKVSSKNCDSDGWYAGYWKFKITALDKGTRITHIDAHISYYAYNFTDVVVSSGTKQQKSRNGMKADVSFLNVNAAEFSLTDEDHPLQFDYFKVYYETCEEDDHVFGDDGKCLYCDAVQGGSVEEKPIEEGIEEKPIEEEPIEEVVEEVVEEEPVEEGSVLSQGNIWIVAGIAVVAAGTVSAIVITKKKKSAAAETEEE